MLVVNNFYDEEVTVKFDLGPQENIEILISNYEDAERTLGRLTVRPYESIVYLIK